MFLYIELHIKYVKQYRFIYSVYAYKIFTLLLVINIPIYNYNE